MKSYQPIHKIPHFFDEALKLRHEFEGKFKDPKNTSPDRFVWDYWFVEDQYTLIRTEAENIFSKKVFQDFSQNLIEFGQRYLGCDGITPPWISYYVDGCKQDLHADVPHGPWAYVYSLTPWAKREFTGGETILLKPSTLDYWNHYEKMRGIEMKELTTRIPASFNQLLVFDPRIPHGVSPVRGVQDPLEARVVIHGWFTNPRPIIHGGLGEKKTTALLNETIYEMESIFDRYSFMTGTLTLRIEINPKGKVDRLYFLTNTLISLEKKVPTIKLLNEIESFLKNKTFPKAKTRTEITLPFLFQSR
jgi:hypothetical protein